MHSMLLMLLNQDSLPAHFVEAAPPSLWQHFLSAFVTPEGIASTVAAILGVVGGVAWFTLNRKKNVALAIDIAFHAAEDAAAMTEGAGILDKAAYALGKINEYMIANKWRELTASEAARAKIEFQAKNGVQISATKIMTDAWVLRDSLAASAAALEARNAAPTPSVPSPKPLP